MKLYTALVKKLGVVPAVVLSQIFYWNQGRLRVKRKGTLWLAKSRAGMCLETGLSFDQEKRAIAYLKRCGLILVERGLFGNRITPHIQLTKKGKQLFVAMTSKKNHDQSEVSGDDQLEAVDSNPLVQKCTNLITMTTAVNTASTTALGDYVAEHTPKSKKLLAQEKNKCPSPHCAAPPPTDFDMNSKDVLAKLKEKQQVPSTFIPKSASGLALAWQKLVPYYHNLPVLPGGLKIKPLTGKEIGMLAKYLKAVGKDEAYVIMHWSIQNWYLLSISVKEQKGGMLPTVPGVNYLLRYYDVAVGCYKKSQIAPKMNSGVKVVSEAEQKSKLLVGK